MNDIESFRPDSPMYGSQITSTKYVHIWLKSLCVYSVMHCMYTRGIASVMNTTEDLLSLFSNTYTCLHRGSTCTCMYMYVLMLCVYV